MSRAVAPFVLASLIAAPATAGGLPAAHSTSSVIRSISSERPEDAPQSQLTSYSGYYAATNGYADRFVTGAFLDLYPGLTGFHADVLYLNREENAGYAAIGVSHRLEGLGRLKLMAGSSTANQAVLPNLSLSAQLEAHPAKGLILRPSVTYRQFRNDRSHVAPALQIAYYFGGSGTGYFVAQADGGVQFDNTGRHGWSIGGGITNARKRGFQISASMRAGHMAYDSLLGTDVRSSFVGGGPNIAYRFLGGQELFVRGDMTRNKYYTISGAFVGFKLPL